MFHIVLLDDDRSYTEKLKQTCLQYIQKPIIFHEYGSYFELMQHLKEADLVISNVTLQQHNQIEEAKRIKNIKRDLQFIFFSSNIHDALTTYEVEHEYFFMKDDMESGLKKAFQRIFQYN